VHRIADSVQTFANGAADAGKGIKIGMLDTGIDATHPGFQGFATPIPDGYPKVSGPSEAANTNSKNHRGAELFEHAGSHRYVGHGTGTAMIAAGNTNDPATSGVLGIPPITESRPRRGWVITTFSTTTVSPTRPLSTGSSGRAERRHDVVNYSVGGPNLRCADQ